MGDAENVWVVSRHARRGYLVAGAEVSGCSRYRYTLRRTWRTAAPAVRTCAFIMLNPSTADGSKDDPTVRRCVGFAERFGCNSLLVVNLFAWRATKPDELWAAAEAGENIVGPLNDDHVAAALRSDVVVAAWGAPPPNKSWRRHHRERVAKVAHLLRDAEHVHALGLTKDGFPRHPLYVRGDAAPVALEVACE